MNGQRSQLGIRVGRAMLGFATTAAVSLVLLAPAAMGSPQTDAEDAIAATWQKAGGSDSVVGAKQGDVYAIGAGFAQNCAHGKIFFTTATGARYLYGTLLDKYESLGGPAGSDLGFPTINEVPGLAGSDSRVSIFSASDKPVMFATPEHGTFVVRGAMNAAWDKLGSSGGTLGVPIADETYDGELIAQKFTGGQVSWNRATQAFSTVPPELAQQLAGLQAPVDPTSDINLAWRSAGGVAGPLGARQGDQYAVGPDGFAQNFAGGKIYFSPATGASALESDVLAKYESMGGPLGSDLGFPTANEADGGIPNSRIGTFSASDKPVIFWTRDHGAFVVRGPMQTAWDKLRGAIGQLGAPVGDQTVDGDVVAQKFTGGQILWHQATNTYTSEPPNLAMVLSGVQVPGQNTPSAATRAVSHTGFTWHWWWSLLIGIAILLASVGGVAALLMRRRRQPRVVLDDADDEDFDLGLDAEYDDAGSQQWPAGSDLGSVRAVIPAPRVPWLPGAAGTPGSADSAASGAEGGQVEPVKAAEPAKAADLMDTATTDIMAAVDANQGRHAAPDQRHVGAAAAGAEPAAPTPGPAAHPLIQLPLADPYEVPAGYPVKGNARFGLYYTAASALYSDTLAEIWFASEEVAELNGFVKAD